MIQKLKYLSREKTGLLFYSRQIPAPLRIHYEGRILRRQSLKTHDPSAAAIEALRLAAIDNQIWEALRAGAPDIETAKASMASAIDLTTLKRVLAIAVKPRKKLSDALTIYLRKHRGRGQTFTQMAERAFAKAEDILGNPALADIKRTDGRRVMDSMIAEGLKTASIRRYLATISAAVSVAILEFELDQRNPFASLTIPNYLEDARVIPSFSEDELRQIADAGLAQKIEPGLIATMQIETGCRVAEIALLRIEDVHLDGPIPYVEIKEHREHGRRLKTGKSSERVLPLLGCSLEATRIALGLEAGGGRLFPRIAKSNPASTVNRWLVRTLGEGKASHQTRHAMETRLVLARTDQRLIDQILGHKTGGMGSVYFSGYSLADIFKALARIEMPVASA
jgi:integrase